ncbi:uncharacterized protein LOC128782221 [Vidua chalybeata]|uniref:uncharacterized protein LOC128782221 n=1 Tax=Vidua chalybeata TaxID=81927 RepID=UPI0023A88315|nr:uncharacterized protein LOC128782221 [Vidua chalybeata]
MWTMSLAPPSPLGALALMLLAIPSGTLSLALLPIPFSQLIIPLLCPKEVLFPKNLLLTTLEKRHKMAAASWQLHCHHKMAIAVWQALLLPRILFFPFPRFPWAPPFLSLTPPLPLLMLVPPLLKMALSPFLLLLPLKVFLLVPLISPWPHHRPCLLDPQKSLLAPSPSLKAQTVPFLFPTPHFLVPTVPWDLRWGEGRGNRNGLVQRISHFWLQSPIAREGKTPRGNSFHTRLLKSSARPREISALKICFLGAFYEQLLHQKRWSLQTLSTCLVACSRHLSTNCGKESGGDWQGVSSRVSWRENISSILLNSRSP